MKELVKVIVPNGVVLGVVTLANLEVLLKVVLLLVTIGYTLWRWHRNWKEPRRRDLDELDDL